MSVKIKKDDKHTKSSKRKVGTPTAYIDDYGMILNDDKDSVKRLTSYVKRLKTYIRNSAEYKKFMQFLKRECGLDRCGNHPNVTVEEFSLNIHHYPFVTEDIIYTILYKRCHMNESIRFAHVADEFMRLHWLGIIGLYPLCETCHEYKHSDSGKPFIPFDCLYGEPEQFYDIYQEFMNDKLKIKFTGINELNKGYNILSDYVEEDVLKHYLYVTNEYGMHFIEQQKLERMLVELLKD